MAEKGFGRDEPEGFGTEWVDAFVCVCACERVVEGAFAAARLMAAIAAAEAALVWFETFDAHAFTEGASLDEG